MSSEKQRKSNLLNNNFYYLLIKRLAIDKHNSLMRNAIQLLQSRLFPNCQIINVPDISYLVSTCHESHLHGDLLVPETKVL